MLNQPLDRDELHEIRAAQRDPSAFAPLYRRYVTQVYRYLMVRLGNNDEAEELTSETFLIALERIQQYREKGTFIGWLLTIAHRKLIDHFRETRRWLPLEGAAEVDDPAPLPEKALDLTLSAEVVMRVVRDLTPDRAAALTLRVINELPIPEIAALMGKNEANVRLLIHRALREVRQRLAEREVRL